MRSARLYPALGIVIAATVAVACAGPTKEELETANTMRADSIANLRNQMFEQVLEGTRFVNLINEELAKARSLTGPAARQLQPMAEIADANEERKAVLVRITQLVQQLHGVQGRLNGVRKQMSDKDTAFAVKIAEYEKMVADVHAAAEQQRLEFQTVIDEQTARIASLTGQVDTLRGTVGQLTSEQNAVYVVVGTKKELLAKGVLVNEGPKRFGLVGSRPVVPARELNPASFTKLDRTTDSTIVLPDGVYKMVSRQGGSYATPPTVKGGRYAGAIRIEQPEKFWSTSKYLILVKG
jgi:hypothetical protein